MKGLLPAIVALALAAASNAAPNALPEPGALFGGGQLGAAYDPRGHGVHFVTIRVQRDGATLAFYGDWAQRCVGVAEAVTATFVAERIRIRPDGRFESVGDVSSQSPTASGPFRLSGRFTSPTSASGTGSVTTTWKPGDGNTYHCSTGPVRWQARVTPELGVADGPPRVRKGTYYGNTSQNLPIVARVAPGRSRILQAALLWDATCQHSKSGLGLSTITPPHPIQRGRAHHLERYRVHTGYAPGQVTHVVSSYRGTFGRTSFAGTWTVIADVDGPRGDPVDRCRSGAIRWQASI